MMSKKSEPQAFRLPAEWEPHAATWLAWPFEKKDWPGKFACLQWIYVEIVKHLQASEPVHILVQTKKHLDQVKKILLRSNVSLKQVHFLICPTDRSWVRDFSPMFLVGPVKKKRASVFRFNGWAKYPNFKKDAKATLKIAQKAGYESRLISYDSKAFVLEGGAIDVNGQGTLLTTKECLLSERVQVRNPGLGQTQVEQVLMESLGVSQILWLENGIAGDDTHGHVDDLCRFVDASTVVLCQESDPSDVNYSNLVENRKRLEGVKLHNGKKLQVVDLPMPSPLYFEGIRLPASYANFYIANEMVLVPTFNDPQDRVALEILSRYFPRRTVIGIHSVDLVWGFGTLHCLTHEQPLI